jgi:ribose-phosphate pyrophosphokinase
LGIALTPCHVSKFLSLETSVQIHSSVRDEDVFILQSPSPPDINDHLILLVLSGVRVARDHSGDPLRRGSFAS